MRKTYPTFEINGVVRPPGGTDDQTKSMEDTSSQWGALPRRPGMSEYSTDEICQQCGVVRPCHIHDGFAGLPDHLHGFAGLPNHLQPSNLPAPGVFDVLNRLHGILTRYGIASRSITDGREGMVSDLIAWATDACRQSNHERTKRIRNLFNEKLAGVVRPPGGTDDQNREHTADDRDDFSGRIDSAGVLAEVAETGRSPLDALLDRMIDHWKCEHDLSIGKETRSTFKQCIEDVEAVLRDSASPPEHPVEAFLRNLPDLFAPDVRLEDDGDLGFDWDRSQGVTVTASLSRQGKVSWAALIGDYKAHGHFTLPAWQDDFKDVLKRLAEIEVVQLSAPPASSRSTAPQEEVENLRKRDW